MKTGKVADMLGVDQKTILNWSDRPELQKFFSPDALGQGRSIGRDYAEQEIIVLNTIRTERRKNTAWRDIARLLEEGVRDTELPPSALLVDSPAPLVQYGKMQQLQARVESLEAQVEQLQEEKRFLQQQKDTEVERILRESSQREGELREQIGELKAMLRMYRERDDGNQ